jgi:phosphoenolpyruvate carboxylase
MATQHPDNAGKVYWLPDGQRYINTRQELEECFRSFSELKCQEYLWDWEGKHVDESVVEKMFEFHPSFFRKNALGRDIFLSIRLPNIWKEKGYRVAKAFVSILSSNDFAQEMRGHAPPIFEAYLPMTTDARKLLYIEKKYGEIANAFQTLKPSGPKEINVIPLVEEIPLMANAGKIASDYVGLYPKKMGKKFKARQMRFWFARSDPALNAGIAPSVLAVKLGFSGLHEFSEKSGIAIEPIIGVGSLPFRGGLTPRNVKDFCREYAGLRTATVQSAFRYDYPLPEVKAAIKKLNSNLHAKPRVFDNGERAKAKRIISIFEGEYQKVIESLAGEINKVSSFVPKRRERRQHVGLFGYSRKVGKKSLPRAIPFVASLYSLGVPPELIGTGRGIRACEKMGLLDEAQDYYLNLRRDLETAGFYYNRENLELFSQRSKAWKLVLEDVRAIEDFLGAGIGPRTEDHYIHRNITSNVRLLLKKNQSPQDEIERAGEIRRSLG